MWWTDGTGGGDRYRPGTPLIPPMTYKSRNEDPRRNVLPPVTVLRLSSSMHTQTGRPKWPSATLVSVRDVTVGPCVGLAVSDSGVPDGEGKRRRGIGGGRVGDPVKVWGVRVDS